MDLLIKRLFVVCLFSFVSGFVINIGGVLFDEQDFYSKYSKDEWTKSTLNQKNRILTDYIKRESASLDAVARGFLFNPVLKNSLNKIEQQVLVNFVYDFSVAFPLVSNETKELSMKNLSKDVFIKHLLISHSNSVLPTPPLISKNEAFSLAQSVRDSLSENLELFDVFSQKHSNDPGSSKKGGVLGWLQWGNTPMAFQSSVWGLPLGSLSNIIETDYGFHLVVVDSLRPSEFAEYDKDSYEYSALRSSLVSVRDLLKESSMAYDREVVGDRVVLYFDQLDSLFSLISFEKKSLLSTGQTFNLFRFLENLDSRFVLCALDNKKYGVKWFLPSLSQIPNSRIPVFLDVSGFIDFFKLIIMQKIAVSDGLSLGFDKKVVFKKRVSVEKSKLLYDSLLKRIVNSVSAPDSSSVLAYYNKNRGEKYFNSEKVVVRQIKLKSKDLADSLYVEISKKPDSFVVLASSFSINRKKEGGLMEPFERGKYNYMGEAAFSLEVGSFSAPLENPDKTFSIILLEEKINSSFVPIERVYKRIESLLIKEGQEKIKKSTFNGYLKSPSLVLGKKYEEFIN